MTRSTDKKKSAVLFSGGKDSALALMHALKGSDVQCLITMISQSDESYMFHVPNIRWAKLQAEAIGIPILIHTTHGEKEKELEDLESAIKDAIAQYGIEAIYTGAIGSRYQESRIAAIAQRLGITCTNPLWQKDQFEVLKELIKNGFDIIIVGVFGEGLDSLLGLHIDNNSVDKIEQLKEKYDINPAGEGGEYESMVLNAPYFKRPLQIKRSHVIKEKSGGRVLVVDELSF